MNKSYVSSLPLPEFSLWKKMASGTRPLFSFDFDLTARCNNDCRHCYINLPAGDGEAKSKELTIAEIDRISSEAVSLGAFWCLLSGGEPLLREDFREVYLLLKKKGLLVSVFTNAVLFREEHVRLFKAFPPRDVEVSVYGATREAYERVTRTPGSFEGFMRGLDLLLSSGLKVRLKAVALRSNVREFNEITTFCRARTKDYFRFDPFLHLRYDGDEVRNEEIRSERLTPREIVELEKADPARFREVEEKCSSRTGLVLPGEGPVPIFWCGAGKESFSLSFDGKFRLCGSLNHPECVYDLRKGTLRDAWENLVPRVRSRTSAKKEFLEACPSCPVVSLCQWCPAVAHLESGELDLSVEFFCAIAHERARVIGLDKGM
jgi:radical SAM protein with 4Fe4S-binding SPASM domain